MIEFWTQFLRIGTTVIGITAMIFTLSPAMTQAFPQINSLFAGISSVTLVVASTLYMFLGRNPPERYSDYAQYIGDYGRRIREIVANDAIDQVTQKMQLRELIRLAHANLGHVDSLWPWAIDEEIPLPNPKENGPAH